MPSTALGMKRLNKIKPVTLVNEVGLEGAREEGPLGVDKTI